MIQEAENLLQRLHKQGVDYVIIGGMGAMPPTDPRISPNLLRSVTQKLDA